MGQLKKWQLILILIILLITVGCGSGEDVEPVNNVEAPTPTTHPIFGEEGSGLPSLSEDLADTLSSDAEPTTVAAALPTRIPTELDSFFIYNDGLSPSWTLDYSDGMEYGLENETFAYSGENSVAVTPRADFGELLFSVSGESTRQFPRERVLGVNFWIYGGEEYIGTSDLAIAVVGSNESSSYRPDDESVLNPGDGQPHIF